MKVKERLMRRFRDRRYRRAYIDAFTDASIATQIKVLREQRQLTQAALAELSGLKQSQISTFENEDNSSWTVKTLKKVAKALDLALVVKFESFGNVLPDIQGFGRSNLERESFDRDPVFSGTTVVIKTTGADEIEPMEPSEEVGQSVVIQAADRFGLSRNTWPNVA